MSRPRLRSKTGCLRCRFRRRKCDEIHPICSTCQQYNLPCIWNDEQSGNGHLLPGNKHLNDIVLILQMQIKQGERTVPLQLDSIPQGISRFISHGHESFRNQDELYLFEHLAAILPASTDPSAKSVKYYDHAFTIALETLWVRDALTAFAAFARSSQQPTLHIQIPMYYHNAVQNLQHRWETDNSVGAKERLLVASTFLWIFEASEPGNGAYRPTHHEAVGRLLTSSDRTITEVDHSPAVAQFRRVALESYLYNVSRLCIFHPAINAFNLIDFDRVETTQFLYTQPESIFVLLVEPSLYNVLIQLSQHARLKNSGTSMTGYLKSLSKLEAGIRKTLAQAKAKLLKIENEPTSTAEDHEYWRNTALTATCLLHLLGENP